MIYHHFETFLVKIAGNQIIQTAAVLDYAVRSVFLWSATYISAPYFLAGLLHDAFFMLGKD